MTRAELIAEAVTLHVPFHISKPAERKELQLPEGIVQPKRKGSTLVKVLARVSMEADAGSGKFGSAAEIADRRCPMNLAE